MELFLKGIVVGFGGVAPGLSGCVLLIIFGLYQQTLVALGSLLKDFRNNIRFLAPLVAGMFGGVLLFGNVIDYCLATWEMPTRYCFLGLIIGTLPMIWKEVRKEGFSKWHYAVIVLGACIGLWVFRSNAATFPQITAPKLYHCLTLGVAVAATAIVPGVDPAVVLSSLGLYEMYIRALAEFDLSILLPMLPGLAVGAVVISWSMSLLLRTVYTPTYCVIFGAFLSMIPNMLTPACKLGRNPESAISLVLAALGFLVSWYLGDFRKHNAWVKAWMNNRNNKG